MMTHTNGPIFNIIAWTTTIILIGFTLLLFIQMI
jgi:Mn2+/Fe2+ NRAMP family transporter